ncbi:hypothetical protein G7Y89_g14348 [Cudoniella acicularis]|uniref:Ras-GAP domain-containing protein n=1 Tax=Cudoniella acicularis TaxID=354080 RepID=A0A8H4VWN8_9HELO|nr:hypothetical protein G7Y89_g14348 [Cudoniella acicularis]
MEKVVKIQSFVRGRLQGEAYKSLTTGKNPPVNTVKNFVHLLNDSDFDFNEEIEFERLRKTVVQQVRQNEMAEQYIDQLDIKIALLVKNKITLDEVVKHQRNFGGHSGNLLVNTTMVSGNQFDLKALNKNSRKKLESYQQLFFTLQTQPQYLARLFKRIREQGMPEKDCKQIETLMMRLFGYAQKRREEYYLLKLIARSAWEEVDGVTSIQEYLRRNFFWSKLLSNYTRSPRDRKYLRELLGPLIQTNIVEDPALDLESDPMQIYRSAINNEELRTGRPSQRPPDIPREVAIKDPETRDMFIDHLRDLREISDQFLLALEALLHKMPYGIRFVCQQTFEALCQHFPREPQDRLLQIVGNWLWKFYLQPALTTPESMGVVEKQLTPLQKRNLGEVAKVLGQVASGRLFGGENIYLQPLNAYVGDAIERIRLIFSNIISVNDAESTFDIDEFNDLYAKVKPTLYIKMADIFSIHHLVAGDLPHICPNRDDMLREIVQELGSAQNNETEMLGVTSGEIQMTLHPKLHDIEDPEAEVKALFMETKRCILYIIRVQSGPNLMEILVRPITREDDQKWHALLREEFADGSKTRGAYSDANTLVDIKSMSYKELKRTALENIMRLEQSGRISRHNFYQDILNAIALDIRTKSRRRVQRQRELEGVRMTLANLSEKAEWLESQRKSYDNYIEQSMVTLQKKGKKRFLMPFTKQYNHERELERSGRKPKFGSFKYSARTLSEKGVLVSWKGYNDREWEKINLTISCDEVGVFFIEGSKGSIQIPGASAQVPMDSLLAAQFANHQYMDLFEGTDPAELESDMRPNLLFANAQILSLTQPVLLGHRDAQSSPVPTSAASLQLKDNTSCLLLGEALAICGSLTPNFQNLAPTDQAECLCYSSTAWAPTLFDSAVKSCADFASASATSAYSALANIEGFCTSIGDVAKPASNTAALITSIATPVQAIAPLSTTLAACNGMLSVLSVCAQSTPGFATMSIQDQAKCLCYSGTVSFAPAPFDTAVDSCFQASQNASMSDLFSSASSMEKVCVSVGDVLNAPGAALPSPVSPVAITSPPLTQAASPTHAAGQPPNVQSIPTPAPAPAPAPASAPSLALTPTTTALSSSLPAPSPATTNTSSVAPPTYPLIPTQENTQSAPSVSPSSGGGGGSNESNEPSSPSPTQSIHTGPTTLKQTPSISSTTAGKPKTVSASEGNDLSSLMRVTKVEVMLISFHDSGVSSPHQDYAEDTTSPAGLSHTTKKQVNITAFAGIAQRRSNRVRRTNPLDRIQATPTSEDVSTNNSHVEYSSNWAGAVLTAPPAGTTFNAVSARFVVPTPTGSDGSAAAWVGIDGDTYSNAILQTGIDFTISGGEVSYDAWYEWYPDYAYDFSGISISAGDTIAVSVTSSSSTSGNAVIENISTGQTVTQSLTSSYALGGQNAEWIVEDYEENGGLVTFADFGTVTFTNAVAKYSSGGSEGPSGATIIDIEQNSVLTSVTIPSSSEVVVTRVNEKIDSSSSREINFIAAYFLNYLATSCRRVGTSSHPHRNTRNVQSSIASFSPKGHGPTACESPAAAVFLMELRLPTTLLANI